MIQVRNFLLKYVNSAFYKRIFICVIIFSVIINIPLYYINFSVESRSSILIVTSFLFSVLYLSGLFVLLSLNKYVFSIVYVILFYVSSMIVFFLFLYQIPFSQTIVALTFETNYDEASGLIGWEFILISIIAIVISSILSVIVFKCKDDSIGLKHKLVTIVVLMGLTTGCQVLNNPFFPFDIFQRTYSYVKSLDQINKPKNDISLGGFSVKSRADLNVVLVLGESVRADHLGINDYHRQTTPRMAERGVISFRGMLSPLTLTREAVPFILTRASEKNHEPMYSETSFISVFKKAGFKTFWLSNQEMVGDQANLIASLSKEADVRRYAASSGKSSSLNRHLDDQLFPYLESALIDKSRMKLIILHTNGSHWNYNYHYPDSFRRYSPVTGSLVQQSNSMEQTVNSYDNTILYMDYFVDEVIKRTENKNSIVIYLSDHGESLGEDSVYGHGRTDIYCQRNSAFFIWYSDAYYEKNKTRCDMLKTRTRDEMSTEVVFHSMLDFAGIVDKSGLIYDKTKTIFK